MNKYEDGSFFFPFALCFIYIIILLLDEHRTVILRHESALKKLGQNRGEQSCSLSAMMRTFSFINSVLYKYMYIIFSECYRQSSHDENNSRRQMTQC